MVEGEGSSNYSTDMIVCTRSSVVYVVNALCKRL